MKVLIYVLNFCMLSMISVSAQTQIIEGRVSDALTEELLTGANVYLLSDWKIGTFTDVDGLFTLNASTETDTLIVSYLGYEDHLIPLNLQSVTYSIKLMPIIQEMEGVVIKAEKLAAEEFTSTKLNRLEIYTNPSAKADPLLAVNSLPSATTTDESANIAFRGSGPNATGIIFNNVPLYDAVRFSQLNGIGTFSIFNTAIVNNMQVFPGNPPLEFGNTASGLISIQTSNAMPSQAYNNVTVSMAGLGALTSRRMSEKTAMIAFFNYQPSLLLKAFNPKSLSDIAGFRSFDGGIHLINSSSENTTLKLFNYTLNEGYDFNFVSPTFKGLFQQRKVRNFTVASLQHKLPKGILNINTGLSFTKANFTYSRTDIDVNSRDVFISSNYTLSGQDYSFKLGISHDDRTQHSFGQFPTYFYAIGKDHPTSTFDSRKRIPVTEAFVYGKWYISQNLILGSGLRKNLANDLLENYLSAQFNLRYEITKKWSLNYAMGQYHRSNFGSISDLELMKSRQLSFDLKYDSRSLQVFISGFRNRLLAGSTNDIFGAELFAKVNLNSWLTGQLSYTYLDSEIKTDEVASSGPFDLNYFIKGNLQCKLPGLWLLTSNFSFREGIPFLPVEQSTYHEGLDAYQPTFSSEQARKGRYQNLDLSISKQLGISEDVSMIIFASVSNVFDFKNERDKNYNEDYSQFELSYFSRRTVFAGAVFNF